MPLTIRIIRLCFYLLLAIVPIIFIPQSSELFEFNKIVTTYLFTTIIAVSWLIYCIQTKSFYFKKSLLDIPLLFFLSSQFLSLLFSQDPRTSFLGYYGRFNGGLLSLLSYSILYWAFVTFMDHKSASKALMVTLVTAGVVSLYGVLEHFGIDDHIWVQDVKTRIFSTLGQPNWLAAYLATLIFLPISHTLSKPKRLLPTGISLYALLFVTLLFTKSRSGLLAFSLSFLVYLGSIAYSFKSRIVQYLSPSVYIILLTLGLTLLFPNPIRDLVIKSTTPAPIGPVLESGGTESGSIRKIVWTGAINTWRANTKNFLIGTGPETFAQSYYQYRPLEHNNTSEWEFLYNKAHNEFLNYLSTTGIIGLFSYLVLLVFMGLIFTRSLVKNNVKDPNFTNFALFAGWISLSITNFWGFSVVIVQIFLFLLPAMTISQDTESRIPNTDTRSLSKFQKSLIVLSLLAICYLFYAIARYWLADLHYATSQKYMNYFSHTNDPQEVIKAYESASSAYNFNPNEPVINLELADVASYMAVLTSETPSTSAQFVDLSSSASTRAVTLSPFHPSYYKTQSRIFILLSAIDPKYLIQADRSLEVAQKLSPTDPRIPYNRSVIAKYQQNPQKAQEFLNQALKLKPDFPEALKQLEDLSTVSGKIYP